MIQSGKQSISIVIPVYNEADQLAACLEAISVQMLAAYEVIVVDNNSTDETAAVARSFSFVTLLKEPKQGVVHARNRGFDAARGAIIARIDADTLLPPAWTVQVSGIFQSSGVSAVSGAPHYYDFPLAGLADAMDLPIRGRLARKLRDNNFLWGANMAVRNAAWQAVRKHLCDMGGMHEDFDLAIHLQEHCFSVVYDENLTAGVSSRRIDSDFVSFLRYTLVSPKTYALHGLRSRYHMYPSLMICWSLYLPARLIYRAYDPSTERYSLSRLLSVSQARIDPTTNIV